jgi:hypothetical protein
MSILFRVPSHRSNIVTLDLEQPSMSAEPEVSAVQTSKFSRKKKVDKMDTLLDRAVSALNATSEDKEEDKWDVFGKLVAASLRELEPQKADKAKLDVHHVLYKAKYE